jgi:hypothetical protein
MNAILALTEDDLSFYYLLAGIIALGLTGIVTFIFFAWVIFVGSHNVLEHNANHREDQLNDY